MSICTAPRLSKALSAFHSSYRATKIHLYKSHTHTHAHTHRHTRARARARAYRVFSCKAETDKFLGQI